MGFEPIRSAHGQPRVRCRCDDCGREEVVAAQHGQPGYGRALVKLSRIGWTYLNKKLRCATCEAKRKVRKMASGKTPVAGAADQVPRQPTRSQKREIMGLLDDVYDVEAERYRGGDTDATLADVLGVLPGWVAEIREEFYGPDGGNAEIDAMRDELDQFLTKAPEMIAAAEKAIAGLEELAGKSKDMQARLDRIRVAVGPRALARAGA